ncbi:MAG: Tab2/Atab2 family RNA-binding protein [Cyanobacteria bacterium MAG CAR2_bin_4]|nr:Tab2/Atab2 family RNA-binding protein [Cyanobacteria bacterium MAG CAR2_bin_4]MCY4331581.1 Tab2/Atab2 family RNA-binding protein [Cyanobacteria bacterium MAG CAR1_bin_15]
MSDWEVDFYSRPLLDPDGRKRWELLVCDTPAVAIPPDKGFQFSKDCPADQVNSLWLREALGEALDAAAAGGHGRPQRLRCWRQAMVSMVRRASEPLGLAVAPSRRCYALIDWLQERQRTVYPRQEGYLAGPRAAPMPTAPAPAKPLPDAARGDAWEWASLPLASLREAGDWPVDFSGLVPVSAGIASDATIPGVRLFAGDRALAVAGWVAGLEPLKFTVSDNCLLLEAGLDQRWLLGRLDSGEAQAAAATFAESCQSTAGLQFLSVQNTSRTRRFAGFWLLRDQILP